MEFRRGKAIGFQHRVYKMWCATALRQQSPHSHKEVDAYVVIYGHSLGETSYFILEFASRKRELVSTELDVKQLFSHGDFQNGNFYKYDKNYENLVKLTHTKSLKEQGVVSGDVIRFIRKLEIYIDTQTGTTHTLPVNENLTDTIRSIKQKLKSNYKIRIDDKKQRLVTAITKIALNDMKDGKLASLKDYGIDIEDKLEVQTITEMILYIKTISGKKISIDNVRPNFTIGTIKELLNSREGIPSEQQRLIFNGVQLDDKKSLESCGVGNEDTLDLELRLRGVCLTKGTRIIVESKNDNNNGMSSHKLIENLVIGDIVLSYNLETNTFEYNKVIKVAKYRTNELVTIKLVNKQSVVCTPNHLIYVDNKGTYVSAEEIEVGDELTTAVFDNKNKNNNNVSSNSKGHYGKKIGRVECVTSEFYSNNETVEVYTIWVENTPNFFANGICVHNGSLIDVKIELQSGETCKIKVDVETETVQDIKLKIEKLYNIHPQSQHLRTKKIRKLQDNRTIEFYRIGNNEVIYVTIKKPKGQEMGLAVGGRMQQKLYIDSKSNFKMYDYKNPTRIFINIANGTLWNTITDKPMPPSPLTSLTYKKFNYPWFYMYDESIEDLPESSILKKVKSVNDIENHQAELAKKHSLNSVGSLSSIASAKSVPPGKSMSPLSASGSSPDIFTDADGNILGGDNAAPIHIASKIQHQIKHQEETIDDGHW